MFAYPGEPMLQSPVNMQLYMLPAKTKKPYSRSNFCPEEDSRLIKLIEQHGVGNWHFIAEMMPGRNVRQVKERWMNYLSPDVENSPWTAEEDAKIRQLVNEFGTRWSIICNFFDSRSVNDLKNRFYRFVLPGKDEATLANNRKQAELQEQQKELENISTKEIEKDPLSSISVDKIFDGLDLFGDEDPTTSLFNDDFF